MYDGLGFFLLVMGIVICIRSGRNIIRAVQELRKLNQLDDEMQAMFDRWAAMRRELFPTNEEIIEDIIDDIKGERIA